jgi:hypothetical protein
VPEVKAGQILASTRVADAVDDVIEAAPVEPLTLKSLHRVMPAVAILGLKAAPAQSRKIPLVRGEGRRIERRRYNRPGWTHWAWSESPVSSASS